MRRRLQSNDLRAAWERTAPSWIAFVRSPDELDAHYSLYHRDLFLELVPEPNGRTLDLGCGEGRLARDLAALGHDVVGIDASPTMVAAAREAAPGMELHVADAAELPFPDASFGLVVAFMSLQDADDLDRVGREAARVLRPGGRFCLAVVHPLNSSGAFAAREADAAFVIDGSYLAVNHYVDEFDYGETVLRLDSVHRPVQDYTEALAGAGLLIERLRETSLPAHAVVKPHSTRWQRIPLFLHVRAVKPS